MIPILDFIHTNRDRYIDELKGYLAIPSVSALPRHHADVRRCGEWTADELRRVGLENVRLIETPGHPVVYGEWLHAPGAPTMLFYGHYDVQPVDPLDLWTTPPFEPRIETLPDGRKIIVARGACDDKGQAMTFIEACRAFKAVTGKLPLPSVRAVHDRTAR
jgi:acetylornithine deacetylase/succinyl-diaminopimelate desuccinylase-like protein